MKATLFALFIALLMVGCGEQNQSVLSFNLNESEFERTKRLAEGGDKVAQSYLGWMYDNGEGVPQDYKEAVKWYTKAAEQGDATAQSMVGLCYADGRGVAKNPIKGYAWFNIAIANGEKTIHTLADSLEIELSPEQLIEAQALSTKINKRIEANKED